MKKLHFITKYHIISNESLSAIAVNYLNNVFVEKIKTLKYLIKEREKKEKKLARTINTKLFKKCSLEKQGCIKRVLNAEISLINKEISKLRKQLPFIPDCDQPKAKDKEIIASSENSNILEPLNPVSEKTNLLKDVSLNCTPPPFVNKASIMHKFQLHKERSNYQSFETKCSLFKEALLKNDEIGMDNLCISLAKENPQRIQEFIDHFHGLDHHQQELVNCISKLFKHIEEFEQERNRIRNSYRIDLNSIHRAA